MQRAEILKKKLQSDENVFGINVLLPEAATCELMGKAGCEFVWILCLLPLLPN